MAHYSRSTNLKTVDIKIMESGTRFMSPFGEYPLKVDIYHGHRLLETKTYPKGFQLLECLHYNYPKSTIVMMLSDCGDCDYMITIQHFDLYIVYKCSYVKE